MNNYDMSSQGENIEFSCCYDVDLASIYFQDFVKQEATRLDMGRNSAMFLIGDSDASHYKRSQLKRMSKQSLYDLCINFELLGWSDFLNAYVKDELIDELLSISKKRFYELLIKVYSWHEVGSHITDDYYISRGYSQGDAVYIVSLDEPLTDRRKQYLNQLFWDCPISMRAEVNGVDYYEDSFLNDLYEWDLKAIEDNIKKMPISDYAKGFLIENLPEYPQYS